MLLPDTPRALGQAPRSCRGSSVFVSCYQATGHLLLSTKLTALMSHTERPPTAVSGVRLRHQT